MRIGEKEVKKSEEEKKKKKKKTSCCTRRWRLGVSDGERAVATRHGWKPSGDAKTAAPV
jgi:hypothetical protein